MRNAAVSLVYLISVSLLWSAVADGADLGLAVRSGGSTTIQVAPDTPIAYEIVAELDTDADNEGLAYILFDLSFTGGALDQLSAPVGMSAFDIPDGITNPLPFGYGGAPQLDGSLAQVGGAQNTIKNTPAYADYPIGSVTTGIAWPGSPAVVAEGTLTAPSTPGFYHRLPLISHWPRSLRLVRMVQVSSGPPTRPGSVRRPV